MEREFYDRGLAKARDRDYEGAIKEFDRVLRIDPNFVEAYYRRGLAKFDSGNLEGALADFTQALALNPDWLEVYFSRGLARLALGQIQESLEDAYRAVSIDANYAPAYYLRAIARRKLGEIEIAISNFKRAAELYLDRKDAANARQCLAAIQELKSQQKTVNAQAEFQQFYHNALQKVKAGKYREALEDFNWAIQLNPNDIDAYYHRGTIYLKLKQYWDAISDFDRVVQQQSDRAEAYFHRAIAYDELRDVPHSIADYHQAAELFEKQGQSDRAREALAKRDRVCQTPPPPPRSTPYPHSRLPDLPRGKPSRKVEHRLLLLVGGHRPTAEALVEKEREKYPGMPEDWYWEKAIYYLERDRGA